MRTPSRRSFSHGVSSAGAVAGLLVSGSALLVMPMALSGCASNAGSSAPGRSDSSMMNRSARNRRAGDATAEHDPMAEVGYRLSWRGYAVLGPSSRVQFFDVLGDVISVHSTSNVVTMMEGSTGANRWIRQLGRPLARFVGSTRVDDTLYVASDNELFILDIRTGEILDKQHLALIVNTPPVILDDLAIFGTGAGQVLAHNLITKFKQWGYMLNGAITATPVRIGDLIGAVTQAGDTIIIDPLSGSSAMRARIFGGLANNPVADDNTMFIAALDQSIYSFSPGGDTWNWRVRTEQPIREQPTLLDHVLYVDSPGAGLAAMDTDDMGATLWTNPDLSGTVVGVRDGDLIVWSGAKATLFRVDASRGDVIAKISLPDVVHVRLSPTKEGALYTATARGVVSKLVPRP